MDRKYISMCYDKPNNVIFSQVIEYIQGLEDRGLIFDLFFLLSGRHFTKKCKGTLNNTKRIENSLRGNVKFLPAPFMDRRIGIGWATSLMYLNLPSPRKDRSIVLHTRNAMCGYIAARLKKHRSDVKFIFDVRGDKVSEFDYLSRSANLPEERVRSEKNRIFLREREAAEYADHIFCVSSVLKDRLIKRHRLKEDKITTIPCCADDTKFKFNPDFRQRIRQRLCLENKFVIIYSGSISKWHCSDKVFDIVGNTILKLKNAFFIVLTPSVSEGNILAERYLPRDQYLIKNAEHEEVPGYLMASDLGVLLREQDPLNEVAAPTKFAEYIMTGLPVLISESIGDYSRFVKNRGLGEVVCATVTKDECAKKLEEMIRKDSTINREHVAELGKENFSKSKYLVVMKEIYLEL